MNESADPVAPVAIPDAVLGSQNSSSVKPLSIRVIGIGGAGGNAIAHMASSDLRDLRLVALHTSARILNITNAPDKALLGSNLTHGLGAGGDPSLARAAAEHDAETLKRLCEGVDLLFIVTGLGGGTGSGAGPVLARVAKECGALVIAVATLPFELEGVRRRHHAEQGLRELKAAADAVICLPNQKIFRIVDEKTSVMESLKITNELLTQGIRGIWQMLTRPGLIHVDFADLCAMLRDRHTESSFATVEAQGEGRAREIIEQLLACPLLDGGQALSEAEAVLVSLVGGPDLCMADVKRIMEEINRRTNNAHLVMGASISESSAGRIGVTLVVSRRPPEPMAEHPNSSNRIERGTSLTLQPPGLNSEKRFVRPPDADEPVLHDVLPPPLISSEKEKDTKGRPESKPAKNSARFRQPDLPLQIVSKGRFEKSQPTIHRGEDLDVPTYVRRGIPLN